MTASLPVTLLSATDPHPVDVINADSDSPILLLCEHAGRLVPQSLEQLGVSESVLSSHRGWDIQAEAVARGISAALNAPLIMQRYSRLVIDSNRPPYSPESIPEISDGECIRGNLNLTRQDQQARIDEIFKPLDHAIERGFRQRRLACFSIHSFTPSMSGHARPWHAGFLSRRALDTASALKQAVQAQDASLNLALNEPYRIDDDSDWFIPAHAEKRSLPHCLIEIRNNEIGTQDGVDRWVRLLSQAITSCVETQP